MAPLPVIANTYRVAFNWTNTANGLVATNVMHFSKSSGNPADLALKLNTHATNTMWESETTSASVTQIVITPLDGSSVSFPYTPATPANWTGHGGSGDFIPQDSAILKLLTAKRGRSYRGRVYLPWLAEGQASNGQILGSLKTTLNTAWVAFVANMLGDNWQLCVASYTNATSEPVLAIAAETYTATQRRRNKRNSSV